MKNQEGIQDKIEQWNTFILEGKLLEGVRPFIARSWMRCKQYGVQQNFKPRILPKKQLAKLLEENAMLLDVAHPILSKLMDLVAEFQYVITLLEKDGYIIDYLFDGHEQGEPPPNLSFRLGAQWVEQYVGTNGARVAMIENQPVQIHGPEHYCQGQHAGTCSAAPIHDAEGAVIGCVNMTGIFSESTSRTLGLVAAGTYSIENQLALTRSHKLPDNMFQSISEGIVVLDADFKVQRASKYATQILQKEEKQLQGMNFCSAFQPNDLKNASCGKSCPSPIWSMTWRCRIRLSPATFRSRPC